MKADLIIYNGKIHTFNKETPEVSAVAIKDGKIIAVGNDGLADQFADEATKLIDLKRKE